MGDDAVVSDVVETVRLTFPCGGLVTPSSSMLTPSPAAIDLPLLRSQVRVVVELNSQNPTWVPVVVSVTTDLTIVLRVVPVGKLIVIWLCAVADIAPDPDVVKAIV